jgi:hypothetical protein
VPDNDFSLTKQITDQIQYVTFMTALAVRIRHGFMKCSANVCFLVIDKHAQRFTDGTQVCVSLVCFISVLGVSKGRLDGVQSEQSGCH